MSFSAASAAKTPASPKGSSRAHRASAGSPASSNASPCGSPKAAGKPYEAKQVAAVYAKADVKVYEARKISPLKLDIQPCEPEDNRCLAVLEQHRIDSVRDGRYLEAEAARAKIQNLVDAENNHQKESLKSKHLEEKMAIEESQNKELETFCEIWDQKRTEYEAHAAHLQKILEDRGVDEHNQYMERMRIETEPRLPRWSPELLRMRKIQDTLGKQKKYLEANDIQVEADAIEAKERTSFEVKRERKIRTSEEEHLRKQRLELQGLLKRIQSGRVEQTQCRKTELERIMQRYMNVKMQLEKAHKLIMQRVEKYPVGIAESKGNNGFPLSPIATPRTLLGA